MNLEDLCKDEPENVQRKIKAAYWQGCAEGMDESESLDSKIERQEGNVVFLKEK